MEIQALQILERAESITAHPSANAAAEPMQAVHGGDPCKPCTGAECASDPCKPCTPPMRTVHGTHAESAPKHTNNDSRTVIEPDNNTARARTVGRAVEGALEGVCVLSPMAGAELARRQAKAIELLNAEGIWKNKTLQLIQAASNAAG